MSIYWDNTIDEDSLIMGVAASNHSVVAEFSSTTDSALIKIFTDSLSGSQTINGYSIGASNNNNNQSLTLGQIMSGSNYPVVTANDFTIYNHKIGINNPTPIYTFDVNGSGNFSSNLYVKGPSLVIPVGTTNARAYPPLQGMIRYNTDNSSFEGYGSTWGSLGGVINTAQTTYIKAELYPNANDNNLRFVNSNIETMRITSNGLIGIGTSNPRYNLDVVGNVNISSNLIVNGRLVGSSNKSLIIGSQTDVPTTIDGSLQIIGNAYVLGTITAAKIRLGSAGTVTNIVGITSLDTVSIHNLTCTNPINGTITGNITTSQVSDINSFSFSNSINSVYTSNILLTDTNSIQNGYITFSTSDSSGSFNKLYTNTKNLYYNVSTNTINANLNGTASNCSNLIGNIKTSQITNFNNTITNIASNTITTLNNIYSLGTDVNNLTIASSNNLITGNTVIQGNFVASNMTIYGTTTILNSLITENSNIIINNKDSDVPALTINNSSLNNSSIVNVFNNDTPVFTITNSGKIGVGTSSPDAILDIQTTDLPPYLFKITNNGLLLSQIDPETQINIPSSSCMFAIKYDNDIGIGVGIGKEPLRQGLDVNGRIYADNINVTHRCTVNGGIYSSNIYNTYNITTSNLTASNINVYGTLYADVQTTSDQTIKTDLVRIPSALEKISQLTGYTYKRTDKPNNHIRECGLLAQDVQRILPEVVQENTEYNNLLTIAYGNMAGLWVEAFKEMQDRINTLEAKLATFLP